MKIYELIALNKRILECENISITNPPCSRNFDASPLVMVPKESQKVLLITRDPSNIANQNVTMLGWENTFFRNHILGIFFANFKIDKFDFFKSLFETHVYWTHFSKCFPGTNSHGGHNKPNKVCAKKFLNDEIDLINPKYLILVGADSIKFITKSNLIDAIKKNRDNFIRKNNKKVEIISITHPSNANNACKNNEKYMYLETIKYIQKIMRELMESKTI
ncbi:MAG: uracil-DNA glycosylase family protein [Candidatus Tenebribacter davisii]|nr:uracil-DNA glycosylase family protein [Candidatus Tenebribacter davisii]